MLPEGVFRCFSDYRRNGTRVLHVWEDKISELSPDNGPPTGGRESKGIPSNRVMEGPNQVFPIFSVPPLPGAEISFQAKDLGIDRCTNGQQWYRPP